MPASCSDAIRRNGGTMPDVDTTVTDPISGVQPIARESSLMAGKRGLVMGVANDHSIAWGIARTLAAHGAELAFTYQGDAFGRRRSEEHTSELQSLMRTSYAVF